MHQADNALIDAITVQLHTAAVPERAPQMQAYMKSVMPYLGVRVPEVRAIVRAKAAAAPFASLDALRDTVLACWRGAQYREQRYAARALLDVASARRVRSPALLDTCRELIVTGAWWDHVDDVSHRVGELLAGWPDEIRPQVLSWAQADDRWLRRTAVICQLGAKQSTDLDLLTRAINANSADPDFFLRNAIGWALREYARTDPAWVRAFVSEHAEELSPLSRREALKHL